MSTYILSHNHLSIDVSEGLAHDTDLFGGDVVDIDENTLGVLVAASLHVAPDLVFSCLFVLYEWHFSTIV